MLSAEGLESKVPGSHRTEGGPCPRRLGSRVAGRRRRRRRAERIDTQAALLPLFSPRTLPHPRHGPASEIRPICSRETRINRLCSSNLMRLDTMACQEFELNTHG